MNIKNEIIEMAAQHAVNNEHTGDGGIMTTVIVTITNSLLWILSLNDVNQIVVICFTGISALFLLYRWRVEYLKNIKSGIFAFRKKGHAIKRVTRSTTLADLAEIIYEAERTDNHDYAKEAVKIWYRMNTSENGQTQ